MIPLENDSTISLKDVIEIIENKNKEIKEFINNTNASLSNNFRIYLNNNRENKLFEIEKEIYNSKIMHIYYEIIGKKVFLLNYDNNNLNTTLSLKHLKNIKEEIETIVEKSAFFLKYTNKETTINSINSNYQINIHKDSLKITISDTTTDFNYTIDFDNDIKTECKSFELYNLITSIEINEIYKNIYFYRKQFPEWMQEEWEKNNNIGIEKQEEVKQNTKKHFFNF